MKQEDFFIDMLIDTLNFPLLIDKECQEKLFIFYKLLLKWNIVVNLTSRRQNTADLFRHFTESLFFYLHIPAYCKTLVDLGSGNGFPALILAILGKGRFHTHLIESNHKKAAFLKNVSRETAIKTSVYSKKIENVSVFPAECVTARALAPLPKLLDYTEGFLYEKSICLFAKAKNHKLELTQAQKTWNMRIEKVFIPKIKKKNNIDFTLNLTKNAILLKMESLSRVT